VHRIKAIGLMLFLDYSKAFDSVPHCRFVSKLKGYGICDLPM